jgi:hypothetical protein
MTVETMTPIVAGLLYTPEEVADYLRIEVETLMVWRATGRYPALEPKHVGGRIRYEGEAVLAFVNGGRQKAQPYVPKTHRPKLLPKRSGKARARRAS